MKIPSLILPAWPCVNIVFSYLILKYFESFYVIVILLDEAQATGHRQHQVT